MKCLIYILIVAISIVAHAQTKNVTELQICMHGSASTPELAMGVARDLMNTELNRSIDAATVTDVFGTSMRITRPFKVSSANVNVLSTSTNSDRYFALSCVLLTK